MYRLSINTANLCEEIYNGCLNAASDTIPKMGWDDDKRTHFAGWNESVGPHCDKSIFWHHVWTEVG
jgi:hypothetical protein